MENIVTASSRIIPLQRLLKTIVKIKPTSIFQQFLNNINMPNTYGFVVLIIAIKLRDIVKSFLICQRSLIQTTISLPSLTQFSRSLGLSATFIFSSHTQKRPLQKSRRDAAYATLIEYPAIRSARRTERDNVSTDITSLNYN